jgi:ATP-binding cassette subfamily B protein
LDPNGRQEPRAAPPPGGAASRPAVPASSGLSRLLERIFPAAPTGPVEVAHAPVLPVRTILRRFWPAARPYRRWLALGLVFVAVVPIVEAAEIWLFKLLVDDVLVPGDLAPLAWLAPAALGLALLGGLASFVDDYLAAWTGERFLLSLRSRFYGHLLTLSPETLDRRRLGDLVSRLTSDIQAIESFVLGGVGDAISALLRLLIFTVALFVLAWDLALVALVVAPLTWLTARRFSRLVKQVSREKRRRAGSLATVAEETLANATVVQAYGREQDEIARFQREGEGILAASLAATRLRALFAPLVDVIELVGALLVLAWGTWAVSEGRLTVGGLLAFVAYLALLYAPIQELGRLGTTVFAAAAGAERVLEILDERPAVGDPPGARRLRAPRGVVELDDVTFCYPGAECPTLAGVSLSIEPGEALAVVGPSGAGKSTLVKLLLRLYDPTAGTVRLDGVDVRELELASLRAAFAVVPQETLLFNATIRENVLYGAPAASEAEVVAAARAAGLRDVVETLPGRYETLVGEKGRRLSGGQRQRVAIARAFLRNAPVLVLDEPTTGLDAAAAAALREPLRRLMEGRTTITVSHDLASVREATRIAVLDAGCLAELGGHGELIARRGIYARLYGSALPARGVTAPV